MRKQTPAVWSILPVSGLLETGKLIPGIGFLAPDKVIFFQSTLLVFFLFLHKNSLEGTH